MYTRAVLPNHDLTYNIGSSFCLEDQVVSELHLSIFCPLENTPVPAPNFTWTVMQNASGHVTPLDLRLHNSQLHGDLLVISGTFLELGNDTDVSVTCIVNNTIGSDNSTTVIRLCSRLLCTPFSEIHSCSFHAHSTTVTDDTECQDGITNNCSQTCTRNRSTYVCGCRHGFSLSDTSLGTCNGDW